ncbi:MAG: nuclear transport factor 2 family protein [Variovorax sp.]
MTTASDDQTAFACQDAVLRFTAHFDNGEYREMEIFFAPHGIWKRPDGDIVGIAAMRERMAALKNDWVMRHVITNLRTSVIDADHAHVDSYFTVYMHVFGSEPVTRPAPLSGPASVGRYHDELVRVDGAWKIALRQPIHDLKRA